VGVPQYSANLSSNDCLGEGFLGAGTLSVAQKHPGGLPPHFAISVQHSPPVYVLQQQSVSAIFHPRTAGDGRRQTALSMCRRQLGSALRGEHVARMNAIAIANALIMASAPDVPTRRIFMAPASRIAHVTAKWHRNALGMHCFDDAS